MLQGPSRPPPASAQPFCKYRAAAARRSGLGDLQRGADHGAPAEPEQQGQWVEDGRTKVPGAEPDPVIDAAGPGRDAEEHDQRDAGWNGCALEVFDLAGGRVGEGHRGDVEARETADPADDE